MIKKLKKVKSLLPVLARNVMTEERLRLLKHHVGSVSIPGHHGPGHGMTKEELQEEIKMEEKEEEEEEEDFEDAIQNMFEEEGDPDPANVPLPPDTLS